MVLNRLQTFCKIIFCLCAFDVGSKELRLPYSTDRG